MGLQGGERAGRGRGESLGLDAERRGEMAPRRRVAGGDGGDDVGSARRHRGDQVALGGAAHGDVEQQRRQTEQRMRRPTAPGRAHGAGENGGAIGELGVLQRGGESGGDGAQIRCDRVQVVQGHPGLAELGDTARDGAGESGTVRGARVVTELALAVERVQNARRHRLRGERRNRCRGAGDQLGGGENRCQARQGGAVPAEGGAGAQRGGAQQVVGGIGAGSDHQYLLGRRAPRQPLGGALQSRRRGHRLDQTARHAVDPTGNPQGEELFEFLSPQRHRDRGEFTETRIQRKKLIRRCSQMGADVEGLITTSFAAIDQEEDPKRERRPEQRDLLSAVICGHLRTTIFFRSRFSP